MIPQTPGLYWRYGPDHNEELVEQIVKVDYLNVNSQDLFYTEHGRLGAIYIDPDEPQDGVEWEKVQPPVLFAHFWTCPGCGQQVPSYLLYCDHGRVSEPESGSYPETV